MFLASLLSQTIVAFTIEFDNESEHRSRHRTTRHDSTPHPQHGPWLVSLVMWLNCMRFVTDEGITIHELERLARTKTNLNGMQRWGYISLRPNAPGLAKRPARASSLIRPTRAGKEAQSLWPLLLPLVEERWEQRFVKGSIDRLRNALAIIAEKLDTELPDCLPILQYGLFTAPPDRKTQRPTKVAPLASLTSLPLISLLSKVLVALATDFERESEVSLAISANVLRLFSAQAIRVRDLPHLAGVSKEGIAMALSFLVKRGYATLEKDSADSRVKTMRLTPKGEGARQTYFHLLNAIEDRWQQRFGTTAITELRQSLEHLASKPNDQRFPLFDGLKPYPEGWRASLPAATELPHYPMVLHRGGFPDGS